jgi:hypothetical protein
MAKPALVYGMWLLAAEESPRTREEKCNTTWAQGQSFAELTPLFN